jgi:PAS domain S-box-containing protein
MAGKITGKVNMAKILAIDDKEDSLISVSAMLKILIPDCIVITAPSGIKGIAKAKAESPDTILLDIKMPGMDGYEVCRRLKSDEDTKHIPVIMVTAIKVDPGSKVKGLEVGADAYLTKPYEDYLLAAQVKTTLRIKKAEERLCHEKDLLEEMVQERAKALRESEERYSALFNGSFDLVYLHDFEGNFIDANDITLNLLGYERKEIPSLNFAALIGQDQLPKAFEILEELKETGTQRKPTEFKLKRKDDEYVYVETKASVIYHGGKPYAIQGIGRDISEHKKAEEALRESEEKYRLIAENVQDVIWTADMNLQINYISPSVTRMRGYTVEEAMSLTPEESYTSESLQPAMKVLAEELAIEKREEKDLYRFRILEFEAKRKDGSTYWTENKLTFLRDAGGQPIGILGVSRNITERKRAEEALIESEERLRLAINATEEGLWEWNIQTNQEFFSPRWCEILGYSFDDQELPHTFESWSSRIHPDDSDRVMRALNDHLEKGTKYDVDYRHRHKSGEYRWQNSRGQAVLDKSGKPIKMVGCITDITERKQAEAEREKLVGELQKALSEVKTLKGIFPICASCKKIRDDKGFWNQVEVYIRDHSEAEFSHGICPECMKKLYGDFLKEEDTSRKQ